MASGEPAKFRSTFTNKEIVTQIQEKCREKNCTMIKNDHLKLLKELMTMQTNLHRCVEYCCYVSMPL